MSNVGMRGIYQLVVRKAPASGPPSDRDLIVYEGPEFSNLITDTGLDTLGQTTPAGVVIGRCYVGTGNTAPAVTQTGLTNFLLKPGSANRTYASLERVAQGTDVTDPTKPFWWRKVRYVFAPGDVEGNVSEVGIFRYDHTVMWSRELVRDLSGNPTSVTVLIDEYLEVRYEVRVYPNMASDVRTVNVLGVNHTVTTMPWLTDIVTSTSGRVLLEGGNSGIGIADYYQGPDFTDRYIYNLTAGNIGTPFTAPPTRVGGNSISQAGGISATVSPYVSGSRSNSIVYTVPPALGNLVGGYGLMVVHTSVGNWKISFSPNLPKNSDRSFSNALTISWGRYTP